MKKILRGCREIFLGSKTGMIYDQKDIAPTLSKILGLSYDVPSGKGMEIGKGLIGRKVLLAIIDSLDWSVYARFGRPIIDKVFDGLLYEFKVSSITGRTSPSIATTLSGLDPEEHEVFTTEDARRSKVLTLPEFAGRSGIKSTVVMEAEGARTFSRALRLVVAVEDTEDVDIFDGKILSGVDWSVARFDFVVCHLRTLDKYLHEGRSLEEIKGGLERILRGVVGIPRRENFVLVITGDHKAHGRVLKGSEMLPFVLLDVESGSA